MKYAFVFAIISLLLAAANPPISQAISQDAVSKYKMGTAIPSDITTPDKVETRLGTLKFYDGYPDAETVEKVYDNLDFQRGVEVFLNTMQGASMVALRRGLREVGCVDGTIGIFNTRMDSRSLFLTANTDSIYAMTWLNLKNGPMVIESPPYTLGIVDDFWFHYVGDLGNAGPDKGKGGKYLILPPGYEGDVPKGYYVFKSRTYGNLFFTRGFLIKGSPEVTVESFHKSLHVYPLAEIAAPPANKYLDLSGKLFNTIGSNTISFYEDVHQVVQEEPAAALDPELLGQLAAIGIQKGKRFNPDDRMKKILTEAAAVGNATARAVEFRSRNKEIALYGDKEWFSFSSGGGYLFLENGVRQLDARTMFFYAYTGISPAMAIKLVGNGSQYAIAALDSERNYLDGSKSYKLTLPPDPPVNDFWSVTVYDPQTRSMLQTNQQFPSVGSQSVGLQKNTDGSYDLYFGPTAPLGKESNWVQTIPGKGWFTILRLYGPLGPWFDKTWQPGEIELVKSL